MGLLTAIGLNKKVQFILNGNTIVTFEASLHEDHSRESTPTEFPVEDGNVISDHIILRPLTLSMTALITDTPITGLGALLTEGATTLTSKLLPPIGTIGLGAAMGGLSLISALFGGDSPSVKAYKQLMSIQAHGTPFTVLTSLSRYENMVISSLAVPRDSAMGKSIEVTIGLKQLTIVQPKIVQLKVLSNPGLAQAIQDQGQKGTQLWQQGYNDAKSLVHGTTGANPH